MRILVYSVFGDGCGLAQQMMEEGHQVLLWIENKYARACYEGIVFKSDDWERDAHKADFVIFDQNGHGEKADRLRRDGVKVWNGGVLNDRLEHDRPFGMQVLKRAGIPIPETFEFKGSAQAKKILTTRFEPDERMVVKLDGAGVGSATSYVASSQDDMLARIESWENGAEADLGKGGILQKFVAGVEISVEGWFDGNDFLYPFNITMEDKKLLNDDKGPNTGCSQNVVKQLRSRNPRIVQKMLMPLVPLLRAGKFQGQIDVNTIVSDEDGQPYALEFTPRPGYDATPTLVVGLPGYGEAAARALHLSSCPKDDTCLCEGACGDECYCIACGSARPPFWYLSAIRTWVPPYPFEAKQGSFNAEIYKLTKGVEIQGYETCRRDRVILYDAIRDKESGKYLTAGTCGIPFIALGHGPTLDRMREDNFGHLEELKVANLGYRTDLGKRAEKAWPKIERLLR